MGMGCIGMFLLPFAGVGVVTGIAGIRRVLQGNWREGIVLTLAGVLFAGVAAAGYTLLVVGRRKLKERESLQARYPDQPWLWQADWASGRIDDSSRGTLWTAWFFAIFWNLISFPIGFVGARTAWQEGNPAAYLALLFPLVGSGILVWAIRATLRYHKYGISRLELSTIPGTIGRTIAGTVRVTSILEPEGFDVSLSCIRRLTTRSGRDTSTSETILWQAESRVRGEQTRDYSGLATRIPIIFRIPADAQASDSNNPRDQVVWRLKLSASVPGVDYESVFEVPVFRTPASELPPSPSEALNAEDQASALADYRQPADSRITVTSNRRGTEILFPAFRNPGAAVSLTVFTLLWTAIVAGLVHFHAPMLFPIVFGLFEVLLVIVTLQIWFGVSRVTADTGTLLLAKGYFYPGREWRMSAAEIADVSTKIGMQAGSKPYYDLVIVRKDGKRVTAGHSVRDKREAEWLAAKIKSALGLPSRRSEVPAGHDGFQVAGRRVDVDEVASRFRQRDR
jgi:hypothetical protein